MREASHRFKTRWRDESREPAVGDGLQPTAGNPRSCWRRNPRGLTSNASLKARSSPKVLPQALSQLQTRGPSRRLRFLTNSPCGVADGMRRGKCSAKNGRGSVLSPPRVVKSDRFWRARSTELGGCCAQSARGRRVPWIRRTSAEVTEGLTRWDPRNSEGRRTRPRV